FAAAAWERLRTDLKFCPDGSSGSNRRSDAFASAPQADDGGVFREVLDAGAVEDAVGRLALAVAVVRHLHGRLLKRLDAVLQLVEDLVVLFALGVLGEFRVIWIRDRPVLAVGRRLLAAAHPLEAAGAGPHPARDMGSDLARAPLPV